MKRATVLVCILLFSQMANAQQNNESFETLWKKVQKFENDGLTKSALSVAQSISEKAKKEKNSPQIVKSLLFISKYALTLEEDAQLKIISDFKNEIANATSPTKNVLESYLANLYWQYYQQNRYQFYNRTETEEKVDPTDFRTWDLPTLYYEISIHFDASLQNSAILQKTPVSDYNELLNTQKGSANYRPTLFDLLAHTALNFYKTDENSITRPADKFEIDTPEILCEGYQFINQKISTNDKTSLQARALQVYQELLKFHSTDKSSDAYVTIDIDRLQFIKNNATFDNKNNFYQNILSNSAESIKNTKNWGLYHYEIAQLYHELGNTYQPKTNEENRWKQKEAIELCNKIIETYPKSEGAEKSKSLKAAILEKSVDLTNEDYISTNKPSRLLVRYKNIEGIALTAYYLTKNQFTALQKLYPHDKKLAYIKKLGVAKKWNESLKNEQDYQNHTIEVLIPELNNGYYLLVAQPDLLNESSFSYSPIQVTNLVLTETQTNAAHTFQVIDRNNGNPISGAELNLNYRIDYDRNYLNKSFTTDKNGYVIIQKSLKNWTDITAQVKANEEVAFFGEFYINRDYSSYDQPDNNNTYSCFLFTDRSIYRPGQPLYFKGIATTTQNTIQNVLPNTEVDVQLFDANYQEVSSQTFKTNEYGSFSGEFMLPSNGLTGGFSLQVKSKQLNINGSASFSVEEYKRPKFEANFTPITETFRVNDTVMVNGKAKAYAGSSISDAKVTYRVKRVVYFPRWYYRYRPYFNSTPQEITFGETLTDDAGNFKVAFKALPDSNTSAKDLPTFSYEVTADITDINGETHSATTTINIGYHTLTATISVQNVLDKDTNENKIQISTTNLNGQFVPTKGNIKVYKLVAPTSVLRPRPWTAPDYDNFSKEKFKSLFPHDAYGSEHDVTSWEKGKLVWQSNFDTKQADALSFPNMKKWESGAYTIELEAKDRFGQLVRDKAQTNVFSDTDKSLADNQLFSIQTDKTSYAIGDKATIVLKSAAKDLTVTVTVEKDHKIIETQLIQLSNDSKTITLPVTKDDIGGFAVNYSYAAYNSFASGSVSIVVPYPASDLQIETVTFRDKLQPGTDETWSFKIKGPKGDKVAAELLASMYDASLDAFQGHNWHFSPLYKPTYYSNRYSNANQSFGVNSFNNYMNFNNGYSYTPPYFDSFNWFGFSLGYRNYGYATRKMSKAVMAVEAESVMEVMDDALSIPMATGAPAPAPEMNRNESDSLQNKPKEESKETDFSEVQIRKNLQETAFFFPDLHTDKEGNVSFSFTTPEALTQWKLQLLAHTKTLESATATYHTVTQKELMVLPNAPRFLREGDEIVVSTKIANLTAKRLTGQAELVLTDGLTNADITAKLISQAQKEFSVDSVGNTQVSWTLNIPKGLQAVQYQILAKAGSFSDGEQNIWPVLTNRMLVTESLPMWVRSNQTKTFSLDKLKNNTSKTLSNHKLTLEITSNPAWYAVQALPYLMEYPYECNEQTFSRYYANTLASHIANSNPRIQEVFKQWANADALRSNLEKNQELKSLLIQETPWLRDAQSETEQKKRIALLFNLNKMNSEQETALNKLQQNQMSNGAWSWFAGGRENRYITQHIVTGLGHLNKLTSAPNNDQAVAKGSRGQDRMIANAIAYLDDAFVMEYEYMKKHAKNINDDHLSYTQVHYLYMRSFFPSMKTSKKVDEITAYYKGQIQNYWKARNLYSKGMLALIMHRMEDTKTANKIIKALEENSITSDELGMYWKENTNSWYWYQAPIETQALLIEAFSEIQNNIKTIDNLKIWLLKNKQTNQWKTTKATTEAVYALLLQGSSWLSVTDAVDVLIGGDKIDPKKLENVKVEAGTGYYKTSWDSNEITPKMGEVQISKKGDGIAWGALYWQYFEDLDKITSAETPLKLQKKLFLKKNTATGEQISEIRNTTDLKVGDLVRVRIELRSDRAMEFIHMKDMRAAGFEPINVFSQYKWQDGLGYYESTKDASTNFFFDYLPKGVYVFEYDLRVNNAGDFSNGITTIQSMYAPEFSSHSEGIRVNVIEN